MESEIVEHARNRAISYRKCGQSGEDTAAVLDELAYQVERKLAKLAEMRQQRDEARREVCQKTAAHRGYPTEAEEIAAERGWDCFKEGGGA
jgi:hypothetical protein